MSRRLIVVIVAFALVAAAVVLAVLRPETFWSLDGPSLEASIEHEFDYEVENCARTPGDGWMCDYAIDPLSGTSGRLLVRQRGDRCWSAATEPDPNAPPQADDGCVSAWQFFSAM